MTSLKEIIISAKGKITIDKDTKVVYGDYIPLEELYTTNPNIEKVEFINIDKNETVINNKTDFCYGQKMKIKITTKDAIGKKIEFKLFKCFKFNNQAHYEPINKTWSIEIKNDIVITEEFILKTSWYNEEFEKYNSSTYKTENNNLANFLIKISLDNRIPISLPKIGERLTPITYRRNYEELMGLYK